MEKAAPNFKLISAYFIIVIVALSAFVLLFIIIHLIQIICTRTTKNKESDNKSETDLFFLLSTIIGLISFEICIIFIVALMVDIILFDGHKANLSSTPFLHFLYNAFNEITLMISIFDALGHISVLIVLISRFEFCFKDTIFGNINHLTRIMHIFVILSVLISIITIFLIIFSKQIFLILITEIIWELSIEMMCLWVLYLFVTKLYMLLKWSLKCTNPLKSEMSLYHEFRLTLGPHLSARRSHEHETDHKSTKSDQNKIARLSDINLSVSTMSTMPTKNPSIKSNTSITADQQNNDLVNVITKLTLLIGICSISSIFGVIGNIFIELRELNGISDHSMDIESIWSLLLPITDIIITSFMLYLQFNFAEKLYLKMCGKLDVIFLRCGLKFIKNWIKNHHVDDDGNNNNNKEKKNENNNNPQKKEENIKKQKRKFSDSDIEIIFDEKITNINGNDKCVESPKTPLMYLEENMIANHVYKLPAILESNEKRINPIEIDNNIQITECTQ